MPKGCSPDEQSHKKPVWSSRWQLSSDIPLWNRAHLISCRIPIAPGPLHSVIPFVTCLLTAFEALHNSFGAHNSMCTYSSSYNLKQLVVAQGWSHGNDQLCWQDQCVYGSFTCLFPLEHYAVVTGNINWGFHHLGLLLQRHHITSVKSQKWGPRSRWSMQYVGISKHPNTSVLCNNGLW